MIIGLVISMDMCMCSMDMRAKKMHECCLLSKNIS